MLHNAAPSESARHFISLCTTFGIEKAALDSFARVTVDCGEMLLSKAIHFLSVTQSRYEAFYQFVSRLLIYQVELQILQDVVW